MDNARAGPTGEIQLVRIAIIGCGAMGSVYAARLAVAGHTILAVDRWVEHVEEINRNGLRIVGPGLDKLVALRAVTSAPQEEHDLVILSVKAADVVPAARQAERMLGPDTV